MPAPLPLCLLAVVAEPELDARASGATAAPKATCDRSVSILSLDGGGMRGLIGATVMEELEGILAQKVGHAVRIGDFFDVIVGTSTGGLQAAALATGHNASAISDLYLRHSARIFNNDTTNCKPEQQAQIEEHCSFDLYNIAGLIYNCLPALAHCYLTYPKYDASGLLAVAREYLGDLTTADHFGGRVLGLTTFDLVRSAPITLSNLGAKPGSTYYLYDAVMATSAAPTYFNPHNMSCVDCDDQAVLAVDGALYANNPALIAYELAEKMAAERLGCNLTPERAIVMSLGTGRVHEPLFPEATHSYFGSFLHNAISFLEYNDSTWADHQWGNWRWVIKPLLSTARLDLLNVAFIGQEELTDQFFHKVFAASGQGARYLRVQVDISSHPSADGFSSTASNIDLLRGIGREAAETMTYRLGTFADLLIAAKAEHLSLERASRWAPWPLLNGSLLAVAAGAAAAVGLVLAAVGGLLPPLAGPFRQQHPPPAPDRRVSRSRAGPGTGPGLPSMRLC